MSPRKATQAPRLGIGELVDAENRAAAARCLLLEALEREPAPELAALWQGVKRHAARVGEGAVIAAWAQRYHLAAPWMLEQARETLLAWRACPEVAGTTWGTVDGGGGWAALSATERAITLRAWWTPELETRAACRARILAAVDARLDAIAKLGKARGLELVEAKRQRKAPAGWAFEAFALYQCRDASEVGIARRLKVSRPRVSAALAEVAELTGIPLRPAPKRGRPELLT